MTYLDILEKFRIEPNFFMSEDWIRFAGWKNALPFPAIDCINGKIYDILPYDYGFPNVGGKKFVDYQFVYSPVRNFQELSGGKWKTVRKNIHFVQRNIGELELHPWNEPVDVAEKILQNWVDSSGLKEFYDPELLVKAALYYPNRLALKYKNATLGIICYDENYLYVNFRYCFVSGISGVSDYARILFRIYVYENLHGKIINDGGSLGRASLYAYKERLNPLKISTIWSNV